MRSAGSGAAEDKVPAFLLTLMERPRIMGDPRGLKLGLNARCRTFPVLPAASAEFNGRVCTGVPRMGAPDRYGVPDLAMS